MEAPARRGVGQMSYAPVFCAACRIMVLCPVKDGKITHIPSSWMTDGGAEIYHVFCSTECRDKGVPKPVRPAVQAHVDFERGEKVHPDRERGRIDALLGYDCIGHRPEYVRGHSEGMEVRKIIEATIEKIGESQ